jgi:hypothetical protein
MRKPLNARASLTIEDAETVAAQALAFLATEETHLSRFLSLTGLDLTRLLAEAGSRDILRAILEHLAGDESLLLTFAANAQIAPEAIAQALAVLRGEGAHEA